MTLEGSADYFENTAGAVESRELQGTFRLELNTSDQVGLEYSDSFEALTRPFVIAPGVTIPVGDYQFRQAKATWFLSASRRVSGFASVSGSRDTDEAGFPLPVLNRSVVVKLTKLLRF